MISSAAADSASCSASLIAASRGAARRSASARPSPLASAASVSWRWISSMYGSSSMASCWHQGGCHVSPSHGTFTRPRGGPQRQLQPPTLPAWLTGRPFPRTSRREPPPSRSRSRRSSRCGPRTARPAARARAPGRHATAPGVARGLVDPDVHDRLVTTTTAWSSAAAMSSIKLVDDRIYLAISTPQCGLGCRRPPGVGAIDVPPNIEEQAPLDEPGPVTPAAAGSVAGTTRTTPASGRRRSAIPTTPCTRWSVLRSRSAARS